MIRIAQVLCPVDLSEISQHALDHVAAIVPRPHSPAIVGKRACLPVVVRDARV
jgi:hypothetical protein